MRYVGAPTYQFIDTNGRAATVYEMLEIPKYAVAMTINRKTGESFDEIASRSYVYNDGGERDSYKLHEAVMASILDKRFDYSQITSLPIPP